MNKGELITQVAESAGISKAQATSAVNTVFGAVTSTLKSGDKASFVGFGTFSINRREARQGRNPQTGATIQIAAKNVIKFKAGKELNETVQ